MMKVSVPSASSLSDLAALAEIMKMLSSNKGLGDIALELKGKLEALNAKEQDMGKREAACSAKMEELKKTEEGIAADKAMSGKYLDNAKKMYSEAEALHKSVEAQGSESAKKYSEFEEYKKSKLYDIAQAEGKIAADLAKAHALLKEGQALKAEYEEKLSKLKQAVG